MANALRGEVDIEVDKKTLTLRLSINAMAEAETILGAGIADIIGELQQNPKVGTLRALLWAGLREHQPKTTLADAGEIIGALGVQRAAEVIGDSLSKAFPAGDGARPSLETTQE